MELQHHEAARSVDASMLDFLETARVRQPSRSMLEAFFQDRIWKARPCEAAAAARRLELAQGETFTFLTVTNKGAADLNLARLALEFPTEASIIAAGGGIPADTGTIALSVGMRLRLTHNIDTPGQSALCFGAMYVFYKPSKVFRSWCIPSPSGAASLCP